MSTVPPADAFWASVLRLPGDDGLYTVIDRSGVEHYFPRSQLRHRKLITKAFIGITDDKQHDTYSTQHFIRKELEYWTTKYVLPGLELFSTYITHQVAINTCLACALP